MKIYRAAIVIEKVTIIELQAQNEAEAKEAIYFNQGEEIGDPEYRNPRIETLAETGSD
ncbi:MAG: hypothetical protein K6L73_02425 [Cellvibrionaceae bacterium]